jgi:hypothetical protein
MGLRGRATRRVTPEYRGKEGVVQRVAIGIDTCDVAGLVVLDEASRDRPDRGVVIADGGHGEMELRVSRDMRIQERIDQVWLVVPAPSGGLIGGPTEHAIRASQAQPHTGNLL